MDTELLKEVMLKLQQSPSIHEWAKLYSMMTWEKLAFARRTGSLSLSETSITQDLLFNFYLFACQRKLPVEIFEARDEKANGNDLEFFVETTDGFISLPCQAKMAGVNGRYTRMSHKTAGTYQLDLLLRYAEQQQGLPVYLLYNFVYPRQYPADLEEHRVFQAYGCSFTPARDIKDRFYLKRHHPKKGLTWFIPSFYDLYPSFTFPFCELFRSIGREGAFFIPGFGEETIPRLKKYSRDDIIEKRGWRDLSPPRTISGIDVAGFAAAGQKTLTEKRPAFNPKFRVIFSREILRGGLYMQIS